MSVESIAIALHHSQAKGTAKIVLLGIANHDGDGGSWPSVATLARYAGVTIRNAQHAIDKLVELGEIKVGYRMGGTARTPGHLRPNLYVFNLACPSYCDRSQRHRDIRKPLFEYAPEPEIGQLSTPLSPATPPVAGDGGPLSPATPEPSINNYQDSEEKTLVLNVRASGRGACGHELIDERHCAFGCLPEAVLA